MRRTGANFVRVGSERGGDFPLLLVPSPQSLPLTASPTRCRLSSRCQPRLQRMLVPGRRGNLRHWSGQRRFSRRLPSQGLHRCSIPSSSPGSAGCWLQVGLEPGEGLGRICRFKDEYPLCAETVCESVGDEFPVPVHREKREASVHSGRGRGQR